MADFVDDGSSLHIKRRRLTAVNDAKARQAATTKMLGRDIRVFETYADSPSSNQVSNDDETDDFYEFTAEDYYRLLATKKEDKYLKTRKIREAEEAACRARVTKAVIRVRFPDNHTLEVAFHPSEKIQSLFDLLMKVIARPEVPFYLYTTPPKVKINLSHDFYSAGFVPGAILYFSYDLPKGDDSADVYSGPFLREDILSLKGLDIISEPPEPVQSAPQPVESAPEPGRTAPSSVPQGPKPAVKKPGKPKWLKM